MSWTSFLLQLFIHDDSFWRDYEEKSSQSSSRRTRIAPIAERYGRKDRKKSDEDVEIGSARGGAVQLTAFEIDRLAVAAVGHFAAAHTLSGSAGNRDGGPGLRRSIDGAVPEKPETAPLDRRDTLP